MKWPPRVDEWYRDELDRVIGRCDVCRQTGNIIVSSSDDPLEYEVQPCSCKAEVQRKARLIWANVPVEFWRAEHRGLEWNKGHFEAVVEYSGNLLQARREGQGFLMVGENGVGKTFSACHLLAKALSQGYTGGYLTAQEFMSIKRAAWNNNELSAWLQDLTTSDFLVLDEVGKEYRKPGSDWVAAEFDTLLRLRRGHLKPTIIISNLTILQFKERYGASLWSILIDRMEVLQYAPGDYREVLSKRNRE